ncbi:unnamed protein product [Urochloa humidicola]
MAPDRKRGPMKSPHLPTAPPAGATEDDARAHGHAHPTGREHMESAAGGRPPMKRPHPDGTTGGQPPMKHPRPADFSEELLPENGIERAQIMMRNNRVFRSLGAKEVASILSTSSNAKSKAASRQAPGPLYSPAGDMEIEHAVDKISETRSVVRPRVHTLGSKRVSAGPTQQDPTARVIGKRAGDQSSMHRGMNGTLMNGEGGAVVAAPVAPAQVDEEDNQEETLTQYERERIQTIMENNLLFESLGIPTMAFNLNRSTSAKSKATTREDPDPLYEPTGDDEDIEDGVVHKVSKRVSAGQSQPDPTARVTRKRAREQSTSNEGMTGEGDAVLADSVVAGHVQEEDNERKE